MSSSIRAHLPIAAILAIAMAFAGCQEARRSEDEGIADPEVPESRLRQFNETFDLQIGPYDRVPAGLLGDNCAFFTPRDEASEYRVLGGKATLTWNATMDRAEQMSLHLTAENVGGIREQTPEGPSPIVLEFGEIDVNWQDAMFLNALMGLPSIHVMRPAKLHVEFEYEGDDVWPHVGWCGYGVPV